MADEVLAEVGSIEPNDATRILIAYLSNPSTKVAPGELKAVIADAYAAYGEAHNATAPAADDDRPRPAVPVEQSVSHDHIICLEDGAKLTMLTRYLKAQHNMTPEEYRAKWSLPRDYPMVAPAYSERRSAIAKQQGLGRKEPEAAPPPAARDEPAKPVRRKVSPPALKGRERRAARRSA